MRPLTIFLSRLIGLATLVLGLAMVLHQQSFLEMASRMAHDGPLLFVIGLITLSIGLAIVLGHNVWSGGVLPVVITLFGWIQLIRGLVFLLAPPDSLGRLFEHMDFEKFFPFAAAITLILALYLTFEGFRRHGLK
ncbi:MAG TPA: hypothetical protein VMU78_08950 [Methylocella sp.]|nr:hypothetical protein [Methylocella sp.]